MAPTIERTGSGYTSNPMRDIIRLKAPVYDILFDKQFHKDTLFLVKQEIDRMHRGMFRKFLATSIGLATFAASACADEAGINQDLILHLKTNTVYIDIEHLTEEPSVGTGVFLNYSELASLPANIKRNFNCFILTAEHVIAGASKIHITKLDGSRSPVILVNAEPEKDLALLGVQHEACNDTTGVVMTRSRRALLAGMKTVAIGHPKNAVDWTVTQGYSSSDEFEYSGYVGDQWVEAKMIQTQTPITYGNSGGGVFDSDGRLLGVVSFRDRDYDLTNGIISFREVAQFLSGSELMLDLQTLDFSGLIHDRIPASYKLYESNGTELYLFDTSNGSRIFIKKNGDGNLKSLAIDLNANGIAEQLFLIDRSVISTLVDYNEVGSWQLASKVKVIN